MNKLNKILTCFGGVALLFTMNSCDDITSENNTVSAQFDTFSELTTQRLPGIYASLRSNALYRQGGLLGTWSDVGVDTHSGTLFPLEYNPLYGYNYEAGTLLIGQTWTEFYIAIKQINSFLGQVDSFSPTADESKSAVSEALYLRGMLYFEMVKIWGDIPLILSRDIDENTALITIGEDANVPNTPAEEVYLQIIKDLEFAKENGNSRVGASADIASSEAAQALLGKVYLQMTTTREYGGVEGGIDDNGNPVTRLERFEMAYNEFKEIIDSGKFALEANYADVFADESNNEVIFSVGYDGPNDNVGGDFGDFLGEGDLRNGGSFGAYRANVDFALSYLEPDGLVDQFAKLTPDDDGNGLPLPNDEFFDVSSNNFDNNVLLLGVENFVSDVRFEHNIARKDFAPIAMDLLGQDPDATAVDRFNRQNLQWTRWSPFKYIKPLPNPNPGGDGDIDFPFLRYADVLLMQAEALNELGRTDEARVFVNMVIERSIKVSVLAEVPALIDPDFATENPDATMEELEANVIDYVVPTRIVDPSPQGVTIESILLNNQDNVRAEVLERHFVPEGVSQEEMRDHIVEQNAKELCYEGKRKDDLIRMGKLEEVVNKLHAGSINTGSGDQRPVKSAFNLERHTHWPIPQEQIALNPNLKQNCLYGSGGAAGCFEL